MVQTRKSNKKAGSAQRPAPKKAGLRRRSTKRTAGAPAPHFKLSAATFRTAKKVTVNAEKVDPDFKGVTVILQGEEYDGDHDRFCSRCHDGDSNRGCDFCPRSFCASCVIPAIDQPTPDSFKCPYCHHFGVGAKSKVNKDPYTNGFSYIGERSTRENWARCQSDPLTIISARLKGMPFFRSVAALIYHHLYTYLLGNLALVDFEFSLDTEDGYDRLKSSLLDATAEFASGRLQRFRNGRFLVILMDHSSPDTGDVHIAPNNAGATTLGELFSFFLDGGLGSVLSGGRRNALVIHSCGGVVAHPEPVKYLKQLTLPVKDERYTSGRQYLTIKAWELTQM
ncbi:hypothetical protein M413DRAFT_407251 [Hebeloma cylindrosporum]|uniref:Uncharacterized protein n=1 Tax=Hebeloma cylindrosporum TaxID=76867 RepID=A0A0C3CYY8_HEBCY|nr:hypothetical protein M413DRAFT_407251 [Hebeloma cylindrosporum h7]